MTTLADQAALARQAAKSVPPTMEVGVVSAPPANGRASVNILGTEEDLPIVAPVAIGEGDSVLVARQGPAAWIVAKTAGRILSPVGTVGTVSPGNSIPVTVGGVVYQLPYLKSYTPTSGDTVAVQWGPGGEGGFVSGKLSQALTAPPKPDYVAPLPVAPPGAPGAGTANVAARDAGSFCGGAWDLTSICQGDGGDGANQGAWFYEGSPADMMSGSVITGARIRIARAVGGAAGPLAVHLYLHTSDVRPDVDVTRTLGPVDATLDVGESLWVTLPATWGQAIVDAGGGIAISGSPYLALTHIFDDPESGLLSFDWT